MSETEKIEDQSRMNRLKPYIAVAAIGVGVGSTAFALGILRGVTKVPFDGVWISDSLMQQIKDHGLALVHTPSTDTFINLIDWTHPNMVEIMKQIDLP